MKNCENSKKSKKSKFSKNYIKYFNSPHLNIYIFTPKAATTATTATATTAAAAAAAAFRDGVNNRDKGCPRAPKAVVAVDH